MFLKDQQLLSRPLWIDISHTVRQLPHGRDTGERAAVAQGTCERIKGFETLSVGDDQLRRTISCQISHTVPAATATIETRLSDAADGLWFIKAPGKAVDHSIAAAPTGAGAIRNIEIQETILISIKDQDHFYTYEGFSSW